MKRNDGLHATFVMHISTERTSWKDMFGVKLFSFLTIYVFFPFEPLAFFFCVSCRNFFLRRVQTFFLSKKTSTLIVAVKHMGEKPFKCKVCGLAFKSDVCRLRHDRKVHQGIKYHCQQCGNQFSDKKAVRRHILNVHEGVKRRPPKH